MRSEIRSEMREQDLSGRYDPDKMAALNIYPDVWTEPDTPEEELQWLLDAFERLRDFVAVATRDGVGLIVYLA